MPDERLIALINLKRKVRILQRNSAREHRAGATLGIVPQKIYRLNKARVKRCGKSTPVLLVTMNAGKPHWEQD